MLTLVLSSIDQSKIRYQRKTKSDFTEFTAKAF